MITITMDKLNKKNIKAELLHANVEKLPFPDNTFDAIHLHWPESLWRNYKGSLIKKIRNSNFPGSWRLSDYLYKFMKETSNDKKLDWFKKNLDYLKFKNKNIIWTWHNEEPHENFNSLDFYGNQILVDYADLIIFHNEWTETLCRKKYKIRAKTIIMPHGNYDGVYPAPRDRSLVACELGLNPEKPIVGCLGGIRDYKGIDLACEALMRIGDSIQFLCAGAPYPTFDMKTLKEKISP